MVGEIGADLNAFKKLQRPVWLTTHAENIQFEACDRQALEIDRLLGSCKDSLMKSTSPLSVPLLRNVDILVVGSTSAAVAASLEIKRTGRPVMQVSEFSYFGSDLAGSLQLWPGPWVGGDPILKAAFAESSTLPSRPGAIKRTMEEALLAANIPFLFLSRPVAFLRDDSGEIAGAVLAARTSLIGITCRAVIDTTEHGIGARLAGLPVCTRTEKPSEVEWTVLGTKLPSAWPGEVEEIPPSLFQKGDGVESSYRAFRLRIERAALGADPMAAGHIARSLLVDENILIAADLMVGPPTEMLDLHSPLKDRLTDLGPATIGTVKLGLSLLLLVGIARPDIAIIGGWGIAALMACAFATHVRVKNPFFKMLPSLSLLVASLLIVFINHRLLESSGL